MVWISLAHGEVLRMKCFHMLRGSPMPTPEFIRLGAIEYSQTPLRGSTSRLCEC